MNQPCYLIRRMSDDLERLPLDGPFDPAALPEAFARLEEARLSYFPWDKNGYRPDCRARVGWNAKGLHVLMYANEPTIRAEAVGTGAIVCTDSCLEFFLSPVEARPGFYFNCEVSPRPTVHLGIGEGRHGRTVFKALPEGMNPVASRHEGGWWAVSYTIPAGFLKEWFGTTLASGQHMRGNFYKCADAYELPHYGMYFPYDVPNPDYHRPEQFPPFTLE